MSFDRCIHLYNNSPIKILIIFIPPESSLKCYIIPKRHLDISLSFSNYTSTFLALKGRWKLLGISNLRATVLIADVILVGEPSDKGCKSKNKT